MSLSLPDFLLARIAEDEAVARAAQGRSSYELADTAFDEAVELAQGEGARKPALDHMTRHDPARVLAECDAKRFVIDALRGYEPSDEWDSEPDIGKRANNAAGALRRLALLYADHPDYDETWRP